MMRQPSARTPVRDGVILLVVMSLLVLFALVGLAFVVYAQSQANIARLWREGETQQRPGIDPELLLAWFLGQLIYDTDNPHSALRGHGLARNMYGPPGGTVPFNGTGRIHTHADPALDDYYRPDYTKYGAAARAPNRYGSPNPPYTYPDFNHMYLAAMRGADAAVLIPSYYRIGPDGQPNTLRPDTTYHDSFPQQTDRSGDVRNQAEGPGYNGGPYDSIWIDAGFPVIVGPDGRKFKPLFAPLIQDLDNRLNLNVVGNLIGTAMNTEGTRTYSISHQGMARGEVSFERLFDWPGRPPGPNPEVLALFRGARGIAGRYDPAQWQGRDYALAPRFTAGAHYFAPSNQDCWPVNPRYQNFFLPHLQAVAGLSADPRDQMDAAAININGPSILDPAEGSKHRWRLGGAPRAEHAFSHGWVTTNDKTLNPTMYNYFDPSINCYYIGGVLRNLNDRRFHLDNMEALYRYGDSGSPSAHSDLFALCPNAFGNPTTGSRNRRLCTLLSMDTCTPGVMPWYINPNGQSQYTGANLEYPASPPVPFPLPGPSPGSGEFTPSWQAVSAGLGRLNLNQAYTHEFPNLSRPTRCQCFQFTDGAVVGKHGRAVAERVNMCHKVHERLRAATGATDPGALRWLAQLAVNIVDFCQYVPAGKSNDPYDGEFVPDDVMTALDWTGNGDVVFGTVLPRLVINEAYVEVERTNPANPNAPRKVNFWVELHNPCVSHHSRGMHDTSPPRPEQMTVHHRTVPLSEGGNARLWVDYPSGNGYAPYRLILADAAGNNRRIPNPGNAEGTPQGIRKIISTYRPAPTAQPPVLSGDELHLVRTSNSPEPDTPEGAGYDPAPVHPEAPKEFPYRNCSWGRNRGWYVLGPPTPFPGTGNALEYRKFFATLPHQDMTIDSGTPGDQFTLVLQRLAYPYLPPQPNVADIASKGYYNPYVTVDWMDQVAAVDGDLPALQRHSIGRNQPYAAHVDSQVKQRALSHVNGQVRHTFFFRNAQKDGDANPVFAHDYLFWLNRPLLNTLELLHVPGWKPADLTQRFMVGPPDPATGKTARTGRFGHRAPWFAEETLIYRGLEFFEGYMRNPWTPMGGRDAGRVNINTVWDFPIVEGLADRHDTHFYTQKGVVEAARRMIQSRTPNLTPGPDDRPFLGYAAPYSPPCLQYPRGMGINNTLLREASDLDPAEQLLPPQERRRVFFPKYLNPLEPFPPELRPHACKEAGNDADEPPHPYLWDELLRRIGDHVTTRSNVFAVWLTVGFFEVVDDSNPDLPPRLGAEIGRTENRHQRHRMFAIIDRTRLTIAHDPNTGQPLVGQPGERPFFIDSLTSVFGTGAPETVKVSVLNGKYEEISWSIESGMQLVVGAGTSQEMVEVLGTNGVDEFTAVFRKPHEVGFAIGNAILGNPGPQPRFDMRHPDYQSVVRYFSIIE